MTDPLILTLGLDAESFARLDTLRRAHFPPTLNRIPAHVTLFHHLPGDEEAAVAATLARACAATAPFAVHVTGLRSLGRGVALVLEAPEAARLRADLARGWEAWLTPQDRQGWRPHVTVQNKVTPDVARSTLAALSATFVPWEAQAEGLLLWRYRGGPWEAAGEVPFTGG